jgi:hypothetical protein
MRKESRKGMKKEQEMSGVSAQASIIGPSIKPYHLCLGNYVVNLPVTNV